MYQGPQWVKQVTDRWSRTGLPADQLALHWREADLSLCWAANPPPPLSVTGLTSRSHPGTATIPPRFHSHLLMITRRFLSINTEKCHNSFTGEEESEVTSAAGEQKVGSSNLSWELAM